MVVIVNPQCDAVLAALGIGLVVLDEESRVVGLHGACREILGVTDDCAVGTELVVAMQRLGLACPALATLPGDIRRWPPRVPLGEVTASPDGVARQIRVVAARLAEGGATWGLVVLSGCGQDAVVPGPEMPRRLPPDVPDRFRALLEAPGEGVLIHEPGGRFLEANTAACQMLGYSRRELQSIGPEAIHLHLPPSLSGEEAQLTSVDGPVVARITCVRRDGAALPVELTCRPVTYDGRSAVLSLLRDLSARRRLDRALGDPRFLVDLLDDLPMALWVTRSEDGTFALWNREAERLSGLSREQVLDRTRDALLSSEQARAGRAVDLAALLSGETLRDAGGPGLGGWAGARAPLRTHAVPLCDGDGWPVAVLGVAEEAGAEPEVERELRLSLQRHRDLYDALPGGVVVVEAGGRILQANPAACEALGIGVADRAGRILPQETWELHRDDGRPLPPNELPWNQTLAGGRPVTEMPIGVRNRLSGATRRLLVNARPLAESGATGPCAAVVTFTDITAQKQAEAELRESHALLRRVLSSLDEAVLVVDPVSDTVEDCNAPTQELFGYTAQELRGMPVARLCADCSGDPAGAAPPDLDGTRPAAVGECSMVRKDGVRFVAERVTSSIAGEDGRPGHLVTVVRDITERRRREDVLRLSAIGRLSAGVAHEFNNILAAMMVGAERADRKRDQEDYDRLVSIVLAGAKRGAEIARRLGALAQPKDIKPEPAVIDDIIESALALLSAQIGNARVGVCRDYLPGSPRVVADAAQLEQALVAVLANAVQAAEGGGRVCVTTAREDGAGEHGPVSITIADNGPGIAPEHLPRVFEPFFTTKGLLSGSAVPGMGLGLCVAYGIVRAHRGTIKVHSTVGTGTEVVIALPGYEPECPAQAVAVSAGAGPQGSGAGRILLVEDEGDIRRLVRQSLREAGYHVVSAASAGAASETLRNGEFDLIITDIMMPDGGGREVMRAAAAGPAPPPVILITGRTEYAVIADLMAAGARMCLAKPFGIQELLDAVRQTIGPPPAPA